MYVINRSDILHLLEIVQHCIVKIYKFNEQFFIIKISRGKRPTYV